ncbi:hypothetical protein HRED_09397 [Candidatus Haloredivivus sp. G17]|nr:hypothetical protein HRED_09397 [Candidatus Haloredivivus sp. G17]
MPIPVIMPNIKAEVFVEDSTVEASVSNGESSSSPVIPVVAVIVVLGIVGFIFRDRIREKFSGEE